MSIKVLDCI